MLNPRSETLQIEIVEVCCTFEGTQNEAIGQITDRVDVLGIVRSLNYGRDLLTTCQPSFRNRGMMSSRTSFESRMNPALAGSSSYGS